MFVCLFVFQDKNYKSYKVDDFDFDDDIETLRNDASFNGSFSIYPMPDDISLYKIHRFVLYMAHLEKEAVVIVW